MKVFINALQRIRMERLKQLLIYTSAVRIIDRMFDSTMAKYPPFDFLAKPKVEGKVNDVTVQINEPAELRTKFSAIPKPTVTWFVSSLSLVRFHSSHLFRFKASDLNTPLVSNENLQISELPDGTQVLRFQKTDLTDASAYIARATNKVGEVDSKINLAVKEIKPQILSDVTNVAAIRDESAQFTLKATGNPTPTIRWFKNDNEEILPTNPDYELTHDAATDTFSLRIIKCKPEHQGDYSAIVSNSGGQAKSKKGKLTITKAPEFLEKPTSVDVNENETAEFRVKVDAYPAAKITWLFEGKPVTPKDGFDIQTDQATGTSVLTIKQTAPKHTGKITVKADNPSGSIEETVQCSVKSKSIEHRRCYPDLSIETLLAGPKITKKPTDVEALLHTDATFTIDVSGSPKPEVQWFVSPLHCLCADDTYSDCLGFIAIKS